MTGLAGFGEMVQRIGFAVFSVGSAMTIAGLVLATMGYATHPRAGWLVLLIAVGQVLMLGSSVSGGHSAFASSVAVAKARPVSAWRQRLGVVLLVAHVALYLCVWTAGVLSYGKATPADPLPAIFGLSFEQQGPAFVWAVVTAELLFVAAVFALGRKWWRRYRQLFRFDGSGAPVAAEAATELPSFRVRLGLAVFALGNLLSITGLLLPALGFAKGTMVGIIAVLLAAGEVVSLASIFFLGKEGFQKLKSKLFRAFKRVPLGQAISQRRHRAGCTMLALHVVLQFAALVFPITSHYGVAREETFPEVFGLDHNQQLQWFLGLLAAAEVLFFAGVYTLGADWWGRFRSLFMLGPDSFRGTPSGLRPDLPRPRHGGHPMS